MKKTVLITVIIIALVGVLLTPCQPTQTADRSVTQTPDQSIAYGGGQEDSEVVLIKIAGGGHTCPGRETLPGFEILGKSSKDISANDLMWEFFQKHPLQ